MQTIYSTKVILNNFYLLLILLILSLIDPCPLPRHLFQRDWSFELPLLLTQTPPYPCLPTPHTPHTVTVQQSPPPLQRHLFQRDWSIELSILPSQPALPPPPPGDDASLTWGGMFGCWPCVLVCHTSGTLEES